MVGRSGVFGGGGGGSGFESSGGAVRSQWIQPHCTSVHLLRCIACRITATLAAHRLTNIPSSVGVQALAICCLIIYNTHKMYIHKSNAHKI